MTSQQVHSNSTTGQQQGQNDSTMASTMASQQDHSKFTTSPKLVQKDSKTSPVPGDSKMTSQQVHSNSTTGQQQGQKDSTTSPKLVQKDSTTSPKRSRMTPKRDSPNSTALVKIILRKIASQQEPP